MNNWLSKNYDKLKNKKIKEIIIPGTHDSGAYSFNYKYTDSMHTSNYYFKLVSYIPLFGKWFINRWGLTQDKNIYDQLNSGIRLLDFRIYYDKINNNYRLAHRFREKI